MSLAHTGASKSKRGALGAKLIKRFARTNSQAGDSKALITSPSFVCLKLKSNDLGQPSANFSSSILNSVLVRKFEVSGHSYVSVAVNIGVPNNNWRIDSPDASVPIYQHI